MLMACERILEYTKNLSYKDFCQNQMIIDAIAMNMDILGEATKDELKNKYFRS